MGIPELDKRFISHETPFGPHIGALYPDAYRHSGGGYGEFKGRVEEQEEGADL